ncbi:MAG: T9SS type A sorting domain-containing protein [Bacteroidales bacterium]|nr:T9SS type A sorting domain-containing protein [Bacteroidales bacterium]
MRIGKYIVNLQIVEGLSQIVGSLIELNDNLITLNDVSSLTICKRISNLYNMKKSLLFAVTVAFCGLVSAWATVPQPNQLPEAPQRPLLSEQPEMDFKTISLDVTPVNTQGMKDAKRIAAEHQTADRVTIDAQRRAPRMAERVKTLRPDSVINSSDTRRAATRFTYYENGVMASKLTRSENLVEESGLWELSSMSHYEWDDHGEWTLEEWQSLDDGVVIQGDKSTCQRDYYADGRISKWYVAYYMWGFETNDWMGDRKFEYEYDVNGYTILDCSYSWSAETNDWYGDWKYEYAYDDKGNQTLYVKYDWDFDLNVWMPQYKNQWAYNTDNQLVQEIDYKWADDVWVVYHKCEYSYDAQGFDTGWIEYWSDESDATTGDPVWVYLGKAVYVNDAEGHREYNLVYKWSDTLNDWENYARADFGYTGDYLTLRIDSYWDSAVNDWVYSTKQFVEFDDNGYQTLYAFLYWSESDSDWVYSSKQDSEYNEAGYLTFLAGYSWSTSDNAWIGGHKYEYAWDMAVGKQTMEANYYWSDGVNDWVGNMKNVRAYDNEGTEIMYGFYSWDLSLSFWMAYYKNESEYDEYGNQTLYRDYSGLEEDIDDLPEQSKTEYSYGDWADQYFVEAFQTFREYNWVNNDWALTWYSEGVFDEEALTFTTSHYWMWDGVPVRMEETPVTYFSRVPTSGIADAKQEAKVTVSGRTILTAGEPVSVYDLSGRLVARGNGENIAISKPGIYIVRTSTAVAKIAIR